MKPTLVPAVLAVTLFATTVHAAVSNAPVAVIYHSGIGRSSADSTARVVTALWSDGRIVWSEDRFNGGPPYQQGRFDREKLTSLLRLLEDRGAFGDQSLARAWFGPDSRFTTIAVEDGPRRLQLQSWHELSEQRTNLVATAHGIEPLRGRDRGAVLQAQPEEYHRFREIWSVIRDTVQALIPKTGEPCDGEIPLPQK